MRVKILSSKEVYDGTAEAILRRIQRESEAVAKQGFGEYLDGVRQRLTDFKIYLQPPGAVRASDTAYAEWMAQELVRLKRWEETTEPTTDQAKAEAERKKAEAAAAAPPAGAAAPAAKPAAPAAAPAAGTTAPAAKPAAAAAKPTATPAAGKPTAAPEAKP